MWPVEELRYREAGNLWYKLTSGFHVMTIDLQTIFAHLAELERIKGHHSPEGRAIRIFTRAFSGWSSGSLSGNGVLVLCEQGTKDWLKTRLEMVAWSTRSLAELLEKAVERKLLGRVDAVRLRRIQSLRARSEDGDHEANAQTIATALKTCIRTVEKHW